MAKCSKCNRKAAIRNQPNLPEGAYEMGTLSYAEAEKSIWYCGRCGKLYCGLCCLPQWSKMKAKTGLSSEALARQIEASDDCFVDVPKCPDCGKIVSCKIPLKCNRKPLVILLLVLTGAIVWWMFW